MSKNIVFTEADCGDTLKVIHNINEKVTIVITDESGCLMSAFQFEDEDDIKSFIKQIQLIKKEVYG